MYGCVCDCVCSVCDCVWYGVFECVFECVCDSVCDSVLDCVFDCVFDCVVYGVCDSVCHGVFESVFDCVFDSVFNSVFNSVYDSILLLPCLSFSLLLSLTDVIKKGIIHLINPPFILSYSKPFKTTWPDGLPRQLSLLFRPLLLFLMQSDSHSYLPSVCYF